MTDIISWVATVATIIAAFMTAANLGPRITGFGFAVFFVGSLCWLATGLMTGQPALIVDQCRADLPQHLRRVALARPPGERRGGRARRRRGERNHARRGAVPGLAARARARCAADGAEVGHCIDAMAGCRSGRLDYVVVSEGGRRGRRRDIAAACPGATLMSRTTRW